MTTGGDYACRERVFAPPAGTLDVDWVAPAVAEQHPDADLADVRAAVVRAWTAVRALAEEDRAAGRPGSAAEVPVDAVVARLAVAGRTADLDRTAATVVVAAVRMFAAS